MGATFKMEDEYITMTRGDTLSFGMECVDDDGDYVDLNSAYLTCKKSNSDEDYLFQKSLGDGITRLEEGQYTVRIAPEDTEKLEVGKYYYDLEINIDSDTFTVKKGVLEIEADTTR